MEQHSIIGASGMHRWGKCPLSPTFCQDIPDDSGDAAAEGTKAHNYGEKILLARLDDLSKDFRTIVEFKNEDTDMIEPVHAYVNYCLNLAGNLPYGVEDRINIEWLYPGLFGTVDFSVVIPYHKLIIADLKYGISPVNADCDQLKYYALGMLGKDNVFDTQTVEMHIFQPRVSREPNVHTMSAKELYAWGENVLKPAAEAVFAENPKAVAGNHCKWCRARGKCTELANFNQSVAKVDFSEEEIVLPNVNELSPIEISKILQFKDILVNWSKSVEIYAADLLKQGRELKGYKLVKKRARRKWVDEKEVMKRFNKKYKEHLFETKLKSPSKIEKILNKDEKKELEALYFKPDTGLAIAPESDRRKAVIVNTAQIDFKEN